MDPCRRALVAAAIVTIFVLSVAGLAIFPAYARLWWILIDAFSAIALIRLGGRVISILRRP